MKKSTKSIHVIAHNIRSLQNVGSIFRTADCFGIHKIFLTGYTGTPPDPKIAKTALGAENTVAWEHNKSAVRVIKKLQKEYPQLQIVGLENNLPKNLQRKKVLVQNFALKSPIVLILGHETTGIPKNILAICDAFMEIPQYGEKESLNVSVAFGIAAYALAIQK